MSVADVSFDDLLVPPSCISPGDIVSATDLAELTPMTRQAFHEARKAGRIWAKQLGREWVFYRPYCLEYVRRMHILGNDKHGLR